MNARVTALASALTRRKDLLTALAAEGTDCMRLLHGIAEDAPGTTVDRYGSVLLVQTWREPLEEGELEALGATANTALAPFLGGSTLVPVWNHRGEGSYSSDLPSSEEAFLGRELGLSYDVRPRTRGQDPLLFLDFRVARRWALANSRDKEVLNLYSYTGGIAVAAAKGGAKSVLNVDFARSALTLGEENAKRNEVADRITSVLGDAQVIARQLAGLPAAGRRQHGVSPPAKRAPKTFDLVILDPPRWAKSRFGAVDVVRDYPSLFKPAVLATRSGGVVLATNHVPTVEREGWHAVLTRTAEKAGRPLASIETLSPEADFPSFDGAPPLKIAVCHVA